MMSIFRRLQPHQLICIIGLVLVLDFGLVPLSEESTFAQGELYPPTPATPTAGNEVQQELNCMHLRIRRSPGCRANILPWFVKHWLANHIRIDTAQLGLPVYIEFDDFNAWQRVSIFCLHFSRGLS